MDTTIKKGRIHLGLGCYMNTSNPEQEIRTLFNAYSQFWDILTILTINKMHYLIDKAGYTDSIQIVSSIYDSIYLHIKCDATIIKWVNDNIIPLMTKDFVTDIIVHNEATGEIGFNWYDTVAIHNNASIEEIEEAIKKAEELYRQI